MNYGTTKIILLAATLLTSFSLFALNCSVCQKNIRSRYLKNDKNKVFCSQKCFAKTVSKCAKCRKPCLNGSYIFFKKHYCSKKCLEAVSRCKNCDQPSMKIRVIVNQDGKSMMLCPQCVNLPKCYFCNLPYRTRQLPDSRHICKDCSKTAVSSHDEIRKRVRFIRQKLKSLFGFDNTHHIELEILPLDRLEQQSSQLYRGEGQQRLAMMRYSYEISERTDFRGKKSKSLKRQKCKILILDNVPADLLDDALAHELAHDYLRHNAGNVKDLKLEEGFAETIAAAFNNAMQKKHLNKRKENNPDPVYGGGYRAISKLMKTKGFRSTVQFIKAHAAPVM